MRRLAALRAEMRARSASFSAAFRSRSVIGAPLPPAGGDFGKIL